MASIRNTTPLSIGPWASCVAVRWRPTRKAAQQTGYLPSSSFLKAYTDYERRCWNEGTAAEAPEVHFASQVQEQLAGRRDRVERSEAVVDRQRRQLPTLQDWVGRRTTQEGARALRWEPGPFRKYATKSLRDAHLQHHIRLVDMPEMRSLAAKRLDELTYADYDEVFDRWMACPSCVERCHAAGRTPGTAIDWSDLVPKRGILAWDGQDCEAHHTHFKRTTYERRRQALTAHFTATRSRKAERAGIAPVKTVAPLASIFDDVIFQDSATAGGNEAEELRYGLAYGQVQDLTNASPPHLQALPFAAAYMFSRAGQELTGPRIGDVLPEHPAAISDPDSPPCAGIIHLRNFRRLLPNGTYVNDIRGKTDGASRRCPLALRAMTGVIEHVRTYRSTPDPGCPGCQAGHGHWRSDDHVHNPHVYDERGPIRCPMAAEAPLWVDEDGEWLKADQYTSDIWPDICERAGLTKDTLGWKPLPKHFRSTGTTLHMELPNPDIDLVVSLGGWTDRDMILKHYYRRAPAALIAAAQRVEDRHLVQLGEDGAEVDRLRQQLEWSSRLLEQAQRRLIQAGLTPAGEPIDPVAPVTRTRNRSLFADDGRILEAVETVVIGQRQGRSAVLDHLDVAATKKNYLSLAKAFARLDLPDIPKHWALKSTERQAPYLEQLVEALGTHDRGGRGLRAV